uniref:Uncharacterized protein n=1 Tax=Entomoneis paludosa TaxID=265537 RepID=A0A7S3DWL7_9STRA|mmetsp:Transcript_7104/g.14815  ORF Transcript_7104/g.14815 Transcript_7104/m.14815 type:complete len:109 (+) Transcript_7104:414-740(+)
MILAILDGLLSMFTIFFSLTSEWLDNGYRPSDICSSSHQQQVINSRRNLCQKIGGFDDGCILRILVSLSLDNMMEYSEEYERQCHIILFHCKNHPMVPPRRMTAPTIN